MNCNTCRFELSQCLDGRLPSGRRAVVMEHTDACASCSTFWAELQAAQRLTLQLRRPRVRADFRDALWQRIQSGEGTPDAVFREPVPLLTKLRYALTGAAAAAAVLLGATWIKSGSGKPESQDNAAAESFASHKALGQPSPALAAANGSGSGRVPWHQSEPPIDESPLISATQPLTFDLVAREAAKQLDQHYAATTAALRRLVDAGDQVPASSLRQVFDNANEFHQFGELLLDLRNRARVEFRDADVGADLRVAVDMLAQVRTGEQDLRAVRAFVMPAMRSSRLAAVSREILVAPTWNRLEDLDVLRTLSSMRPDLFPKLFVVLPSEVSGASLFQFDECGPSWVAPRSEVEARDEWLRINRSRRSNSGADRAFELRIEVHGK